MWSGYNVVIYDVISGNSKKHVDISASQLYALHGCPYPSAHLYYVRLYVSYILTFNFF